MLAALDDWNTLRTAHGEPPLRAGIGLYAGPVVLGDIGDERRMEFAVLGDTVNVATRLEALTRGLSALMAVSQTLVDRVLAQGSGHLLDGMRQHAPLVVCGRTEALDLWILPTSIGRSAAAGSG